jgi:hypothetical protein
MSTTLQQAERAMTTSGLGRAIEFVVRMLILLPRIMPPEQH